MQCVAAAEGGAGHSACGAVTFPLRSLQVRLLVEEGRAPLHCKDRFWPQPCTCPWTHPGRDKRASVHMPCWVCLIRTPGTIHGLEEARKQHAGLHAMTPLKTCQRRWRRGRCLAVAGSRLARLSRRCIGAVSHGAWEPVRHQSSTACHGAVQVGPHCAGRGHARAAPGRCGLPPGAGCASGRPTQGSVAPHELSM